MSNNYLFLNKQRISSVELENKKHLQLQLYLQQDVVQSLEHSEQAANLFREIRK